MRISVIGAGIAALVLSFAAGCGGASSKDCAKLCDWWAGYCTKESRDSCMSDCGGASADDVDHASQVCLSLDATGCKGASCCLGFIYEPYYQSQNC